MINFQPIINIAVPSFFACLLLSACSNRPSPSVIIPPDTTPPTITITSSTLSITNPISFTLTANVTDNMGVSNLEFFKNGTPIGDFLPTQIVPINSADNGIVKFTATAKDVAGNSRTSEPINITVNILTNWPRQFTINDDYFVNSIAIDKTGNIIIAGFTSSLSNSPDNITPGFDAFIAKYDAQGNQTWIKKFGTGGDDRILSVVVDTNGNIIVGGFTNSAFQGFTNTGISDAFIAKYDPNGKQTWLKQFGTSSGDKVSSVAVDGNTVIATGVHETVGQGFPDPSSNGGFITRYDSNGDQIWFKLFGKDGLDYIQSVSVAGNSDIIIGGFTGRALTSGGGDAFIGKYDSNGDQTWFKQFGTSGTESISSVAVDSKNNVFVGGITDGLFNGSTDVRINDAFVAKFDSNGNQTWLKQFGTSSTDYVNGIAVDADGNVIVAGYTLGSFSGYTKAGFSDAFVTKYDPSGNQTWLKSFGTGGDDRVLGVAVSSGSDIFVAGQTNGAFDGFPNSNNYKAFIDSFTASSASR